MAAVLFMAKASTDSTKIDFRLDCLLDPAGSSCSVWLCVSDVVVTCIDLKRVNTKGSRRWIVLATAPIRSTHLKLPWIMR